MAESLNSRLLIILKTNIMRYFEKKQYSITELLHCVISGAMTVQTDVNYKRIVLNQTHKNSFITLC